MNQPLAIAPAALPFARAYWHTGTREGWGPGPWQHEPDKAQWVDPATDLDCLIVRGRLGALCGYVGVPPGHVVYGVDYGDAEDEHDFEVHGGLSFSDLCAEGDDESCGICHVPLPGRAPDVWWLGFDCAHFMDLSPGLDASLRWMGIRDTVFSGETYRTIDYVRAQCAYLAAQVARL